jgi:hypothetical protein
MRLQVIERNPHSVATPHTRKLQGEQPDIAAHGLSGLTMALGGNHPRSAWPGSRHQRAFARQSS